MCVCVCCGVGDVFVLPIRGVGFASDLDVLFRGLRVISLVSKVV